MGSTCVSCTSVVERWSRTSKSRIETISSPQNSMRTGSPAVTEKTSRMPPRTANWPTSSTRATRSKPRSSRARGQLGERDHVAHLERLAQLGQAGGDGHALLQRPWRGDQDVRPAREEGLHGLDAQAADLQVRLGLLVGERLLLRVEARLALAVRARPRGPPGRRSRPGASRRGRRRRAPGGRGGAPPRPRRPEEPTAPPSSERSPARAGGPPWPRPRDTTRRRPEAGSRRHLGLRGLRACARSAAPPPLPEEARNDSRRSSSTAARRNGHQTSGPRRLR